MPQFVVRGTVDAGERLPLVEERAEAVHATAPISAGAQCLGLDDHGLLRGDRGGVLLGAGGLAGLDLRRQHLSEGFEAGYQ